MSTPVVPDGPPGPVGSAALPGMTVALDGSIACPHCARPVPAEQDWCLACGAAARTRLARPPDWRVPLAAVGALLALAALVLVLAFVDLTRDDEPVVAPTGPTVVQPPAADPTVVPPPAAGTPATGAPAAGTTLG